MKIYNVASDRLDSSLDCINLIKSICDLKVINDD